MRTGAYLLAQARVRGLNPPAAARAVGREVARFGLDRLVGVPLGQLSRGSAQKVGLAQALLVPPGLLVLDEPWSGLDATARQAIPGVVHDVLQSGGAVAVADHQQQVASLAPDLRWHVQGGTVGESPASGVRPVVVEVEVTAEQAPGLLEELRRRGLTPRVQ